MPNKMLKDEQSIIKQIILLAIPIIGTFLSQKLIQVITTFMLGHINTNALAAGGLFITFYTLIIVISIGIFNAVNVFIARVIGTNQLNLISKYVIQGCYIAIALSILIILGLWYAPHILFSIPEYYNIAPQVLILSKASSFGVPGTLFYLVFKETLTALKLPKINFYVVILSIPILIIMDYFIIFILKIDDNMKIMLVGFANAIIEWFLFIGILCYCFISNKVKPIILKDITFQLCLPTIKNILRLGIPTAMIFMLDVGMVLAASILTGYFGAVSLSAYQISLQLGTIAYMFPMGISLAVTTLISHQFGTNNFTEIRKIFKNGINLGLIIAIVILLIYIFFGSYIASIFMDSNEANFNAVIHYATIFLIVAGATQLFDSILAISNSTLRGLGDVMIPMYYCILCYWLIGVSSMFILGFLLKLNALGIWLGLCLGIGCACILTFIRAYKRCFSVTLT